MNSKALSSELGLVVEPVEGAGGGFPSRAEILELLAGHGVVTFRGFPITLEQFHRLSDHVAAGVKRGVVEGPEGIQYHGEARFLPIQIDVLWFYCITPAASGGRTKVVDGVRVLAELRGSTREFFARNPLVYDFTFHRDVWKPLLVLLNNGKVPPSHPVLAPKTARDAVVSFETFGLTASVDHADGIRAHYETDAIGKTHWGGEDAFVNTLLHAIDPGFRSKQSYTLTTRVPDDIIAEVREITDRLTLWLTWESGDVVVVDNSRLMHGRQAFVPPRKILAVNGRIREPAV